MSTNPFRFKQFTVHQDRCAMKVGTDGVLLGSWATINHNPSSVLDVGAGTGLLSLMLAQRTEAMSIDALEIDSEAYEQCVENFERSNWNDRLFCYHASFQEFVNEMDEEYDLIVSNPPFYSNAKKSQNEQRDLARFSDALPFEHLIYGVAKLLSEKGKFSIILPNSEEEKFKALAKSCGLYPEKILRIKGNSNTELKRSLLTFGFEKINPNIDFLTIEEKRHQFTPEVIALTKDFYLKM